MITAFLIWLFDLKGWVKALAMGVAGLCLLYWWKGDKR